MGLATHSHNVNEYLLKQAQSMTQLEQSPTFLALVCLSVTSSAFSNFIRLVTFNCSAFRPLSCLCQPKLLSINYFILSNASCTYVDWCEIPVWFSLTGLLGNFFSGDVKSSILIIKKLCLHFISLENLVVYSKLDANEVMVSL